MSKAAPRMTETRRKPRVTVSLQQAIDNYLIALKLEGKSEATLIWYRKRLAEFRAYVDQQGPGDDVRTLDTEDGRAYVRYLMARTVTYPNHKHRQAKQAGLSLVTINGSVRAIRAFASWLGEEGYTDDNVFKPIKPPKPPKTVIQPLTADEIRLLLSAIPQDRPEGARNYAIMSLFIDSGLRVSELVNIKVLDLDFSLGEVKVTGKGNKQRVVPVGLGARRALARYRDQFRPEPVSPMEEFFFLNVAGYPLSVDGVEHIIQRLAKRTGLERLHPHLLRHSAAVHYIKNGGDAFSLQRLLGHASLEMTKIYVTLADADVKEKHKLFSPIDNLNAEIRRRGRPKGS